MADKKEHSDNPTLDYEVLNNYNKFLDSVPFTHLISKPLTACVIAQNDSDMATLEAMKAMGLISDEKGNSTATRVSFEFLDKDGQLKKMMVPLITLVPINFFAINTVNISFKACVKNYANNITIPSGIIDKKVKNNKSKSEDDSASDSGVNLKSLSGKDIKGVLKKAYDYFVKYKGKGEDSAKADYSNKKDSVATKNSKYSVESTVDFDVTAIRVNMPIGLTKVIETLNNSVSAYSSNGCIDISSNRISLKQEVIIKYFDSDGFLDNDKIKFSPDKDVKTRRVDNAVICTFTKPGTYTITANELQQEIEVSEN